MGEILDRAWRRRAVLSLPVLVVLVMVCGVMAAGARAAVPSAMTFTPGNNSASFTGHVNVSNFLQPTCDQSVTPQCAPGTSPTPCPMQAADATNLVCEHFTVSSNQPGIAYACVSFPGGENDLNDIDDYVLDSTGTVVASNTDMANPECVTFDMAVGVSYELQMNPAFVEDLFGFDVTGTVTFTPSTFGSAAGSKEQGLNSEMEGGGKLVDGTHFHVQLAQLEENERKIEVKSKDHGPCAFKATSFTVVQIYATTYDAKGQPTGGKAHVEGGGLNYKQPVSFVVDITDGGDHGNGDTFSISTSDGCQDAGPLTDGDVEYEVSR